MISFAASSESDSAVHMPAVAPASATAALTVEHIVVGCGRISLRVRVTSGIPHMTDTALARRLLARYPSLAYHTCVNDEGPTFAAVIEHTPLPHMLEHLIIDGQARDGCSLTDVTFMGTTEWLDEAAGSARVEVNFVDDLVALRALCRALEIINEEVSTMGSYGHGKRSGRSADMPYRADGQALSSSGQPGGMSELSMRKNDGMGRRR